MASKPTFTIFAAPATERGALSGYGFRCDACGSVQKTSLGEDEARRMAFAHTDYHLRKGA